MPTSGRNVAAIAAAALGGRMRARALSQAPAPEVTAALNRAETVSVVERSG